MKIQHEERNTPTFRQWAKTADIDPKDSFLVERIFLNSDWRTVTFVTNHFRINIKHPDAGSFNKAHSDIHKIVTKHCLCLVRVSDKQHASIDLLPASDANESAQIYEQDDLGYTIM